MVFSIEISLTAEEHSGEQSVEYLPISCTLWKRPVHRLASDVLDSMRPDSEEDLTRLGNPRPAGQQPVSCGSTSLDESSLLLTREEHEDDDPAMELT